MPDGSTGRELRCPRGKESCDKAASRACDGSYYVVSSAELPGTERGLLWRVACGSAPIAEAAPAKPPAPSPPVVTTTAPAASEPAPAPRPRLHDQVALEFYSTTGSFERYQVGRLVEQTEETTWRNGGLRFSRVGPGQWVLAGNLGTDAVEVSTTPTTLVLVERSPINAYFHVLTVYDEWHAHARGFRATYLRTVELGGDRMLSRYDGYMRVP